MPAGCARRQMTFHNPMGAAGLEPVPLPMLICSELKDQRLTSGPNCWLRRGTGACIPGGCSPQRRALSFGGYCTTHRLCDLHRTAGSIAWCHAEMPTAVRGSRELVGPMSARNGNLVANHPAYRSRAHSAPKWMTEQLRAAAYVEVNPLKPGSAVTLGNGPEVVAGHFYSAKPAAASLVGRRGDRSCCTLCGLTGDCKTSPYKDPVAGRPPPLD